jgi:hypothetical protein
MTPCEHAHLMPAAGLQRGCKLVRLSPLTATIFGVKDLAHDTNACGWRHAESIPPRETS